MRFFIDMDGTLAKWKYVDDLEELYRENYYLNLEPLINMLNVTKEMIKNNENVYILSAYLTDSKYARSEKEMWLQKYLPELDKNKYIFIGYGYKKSNAIQIKEDDILIDDYTENLVDWRNNGGIAIKLLNGINHTHQSWTGECIKENQQLSYQEIIQKVGILFSKSLMDEIIDITFNLSNSFENYVFYYTENGKILEYNVDNLNFKGDFKYSELRDYAVKNLETYDRTSKNSLGEGIIIYDNYQEFLDTWKPTIKDDLENMYYSSTESFYLSEKQCDIIGLGELYRKNMSPIDEENEELNDLEI